VFSLCLATTGGVLNLGGIDPTLFSGSISYTPIVEEKYYSIQLKALTIDGVANSIPSQKVVIDSGTSLITTPPPLFNQIADMMVASTCPNGTAVKSCAGLTTVECVICTGKLFNTSVSLQTSDILSLPLLTFTFSAGRSSITVTMDGIHYMRPDPLNSLNKIFVFVLQQTNVLVLGDYFMRDRYIIFDRANKRIGFATANSTACSRILPNLPTQIPSSPHQQQHVNTLVFVILVSIGGIVIFVLAVVAWFECMKNRSTYGYELANTNTF